MANRSITYKETFNPFSFERYLQPILLYEQAYNNVNSQIEQLTLESAEWEKLADSAIDQDSYEKYKSFANALQLEAENLAINGLSPQSRSSLLSLKKQYGTNIAPLSEAWTNREKTAQLQNQQSITDPTIRFEQSAYDTPLSKYINKPSPHIRSISGKNIREDVAKQMQYIAKQLVSYDTNGNLTSTAKKVLADYGLDAADVAILAKDPRKLKQHPIVGDIVARAIETSGINDWENKDTDYYLDMLDYAYNRAVEGVYAGIGEDKPSYIEDKEAVAGLKPNGNNEISFEGVPVNSRKVFSVKERTKGKEDYNKYLQYFTKDETGAYKLTKGGQNKYNESSEYVVPRRGFDNNEIPIEGPYELSSQSDFKNHMYKIGQAQGFTKEQIDKMANTRPGEFANLFFGYHNQSNDSDPYDATQMNEFLGDIHSSHFKTYMQNIGMSGNSQLKVLDFDPKQKKYVPTGDTIDVTDLSREDSDYVAGQISYSRYGDTLILLKKSGEMVKVEVPRGLRSTVETNNSNNFKIAYAIQDLLNGDKLSTEEKEKYAKSLGKTISQFNDEINLIKNDANIRAQYERDYKYAILSAMNYHQQKFGEPKTEPYKAETQTIQ